MVSFQPVQPHGEREPTIVLASGSYGWQAGRPAGGQSDEILHGKFESSLQIISAAKISSSRSLTKVVSSS